jgi:hypothetical protein
MAKSLTIHLSDAQYEAIRAAAERARQSPEELIAATVAARFGEPQPNAKPPAQTPEQQAKDVFLSALRERGLLAEPKSLPPYPGVEKLSPRGSPERAQLEEKIADELSDGLERSGLSILDLIERR